MSAEDGKEVELQPQGRLIEKSDQALGRAFLIGTGWRKEVLLQFEMSRKVSSIKLFLSP
jgi:predicted transcriptional regulator